MPIEKSNSLFGKINVYPPEEEKQRVEIYIRLYQKVEKMKVGIAVDGSFSMKKLYAAHIPKERRSPSDKVMESVVRRLCRFICDYSGDGTVQPIYWAVGDRGEKIEPLGKLDATASETLVVEGPQQENWGTGTSLLPPLNYFLSEFADAPWSIVLFITDGTIADLDAVIVRALEVGREIVTEKRGNCKFVVVGLGEEVDEEQLKFLDNMFDGTPLEEQGVDLWDCKLANGMAELQDIWDEVDFGILLPGHARITDDRGQEVKSYSDGIPQRMEFWVREGTQFVTVEMAGQTIVQSLTEA